MILLNTEENKVITYTEEICNEVGQKITNNYYEMGNMCNKYFTEIDSKLASQVKEI